ncbi:MAG: histidinol dehydrogenase [Bacteroidaceae bacterium]|nr:histidinol dehydrogenase [Bacteroidaceae bacterium]
MLQTHISPDKNTWPALMLRATDDDTFIEQRVRTILERIRQGGDEALRAITTEIDGHYPESLQVSETEFTEAESLVSDELKSAIRQAASNISAFHKAQQTPSVDVYTMPGVHCRRRVLPIRRVGLYIPGGSAPLFSTILMLALPAQIAGCEEIVLCTPCDRTTGKVNPVVLYTAQLCGVRTIYKLGGAQAIAAMAYGTESIARVFKIFGPGNRYVTKAKQMVSAQGTAIDMPAGPSEVMIMADDSARPDFVAADFLSQAEHGPDSQSLLVCRSQEFAEQVNAEIARQLALLPRADIATRSLANSRIVVFDDIDTMIAFANAYASEHLIIAMDDAWAVADRITAAGSIFVGHYSPESAGDYASGTNHTLPTMGLASAYSGIGLDSFMHAITYQELSQEGLNSLSNTIIRMAEAEGLDAHANAVKVRVEGPLLTSPKGEGLQTSQSVSSPLGGNEGCQALVRPNIAALKPYSTARDEYKGSIGIYLDANENPFDNGYNRYPSTALKEQVRSAIAQKKGVNPTRLFLGNGSDEAIDLLFRIFCRPGIDNIVSIAPTYGMYSVCAAINDIECREVMLGEDFSLPVEALLSATDMQSKLLFVCSPNNPTANAFPREQLVSLLSRFPGIVVIDEAYIDFSSVPSMVELIDQYPNLIVLQTLSKAYGLAGLRMGLAFAEERIIRLFEQVKYPYNIGTDTLALALRLLETDITPQVQTLIAERERVAAALTALPYIEKVYPSDANFLLVKTARPRELYDYLIARELIVRDRSRTPGCEGTLRITIGTPEENDRLIRELRVWS